MEAKVGYSEQMKQLLVQAEAYDRRKNYVYFDHVWQKAENIMPCAKIVFEFISSIISEQDYFSPSHRKKLVILSPDSLGGNFGILPISFFVADLFNCQVAIWRELANIKWAKPDIVGFKQKGLNCILLQDVVDQGTTVLKVAHTIREENLEWKIRLYISAVLNNDMNDISVVRKTISKIGDILDYIPKFEYIISTKELI